MWYFAWMLGVALACAFGIINAMWLEAQCDMDAHDVQGFLRNSDEGQSCQPDPYK